MGTSSRKNSPKSGVNFEPNWLGSTPEPTFPKDQQIEPQEDPAEQQPENMLEPEKGTVAQELRFKDAKIALTGFIKSGGESGFRKAQSNYVKKGLGGPILAARRMKASANASAALFQFLSSIISKEDQAVNEWVREISARELSPKELQIEMIKFAVPEGGSIDEASIETSMTRAFTELLIENPDVNLLDIDEDFIWVLIEKYYVHEIFNRLYQDIGQYFEISNLSSKEIISREDSIRTYIREDVRASIRDIRSKEKFTKQNTQQIFLKIFQRVYEIFGESDNENN